MDSVSEVGNADFACIARLHFNLSCGIQYRAFGFLVARNSYQPASIIDGYSVPVLFFYGGRYGGQCYLDVIDTQRLCGLRVIALGHGDVPCQVEVGAACEVVFES